MSRGSSPVYRQPSTNTRDGGTNRNRGLPLLAPVPSKRAAKLVSRRQRSTSGARAEWNFAFPRLCAQGRKLHPR